MRAVAVVPGRTESQLLLATSGCPARSSIGFGWQVRVCYRVSLSDALRPFLHVFSPAVARGRRYKIDGLWAGDDVSITPMSQPDSQWLAAVDNVVEAALAHGGASAGGRRRSGMVLAGVASTLTCTPVLCAIARHFASASVSAVLQAQPSSAWRSALACHGLAPHHPLPANFIIAKLLNACYAVPREAVTAGTPAPGSLPNTELPFGFHADGQRTVAEQVDAAMGVGTATATAWTAATAAARAHATRVLLACVSASSVDAELASSAGEALVRGCVASDKVRSRCSRCWV